MRGRDLLQDMEYIDDKLVEEAAQISSKGKKSGINKTSLLRYGSIAACLAIVVVGSGIAIQQSQKGAETESAVITDTAMQYDTSTETTANTVGQEMLEDEMAVEGVYDMAGNKNNVITEEKKEDKQDAIQKDTASVESAMEESDVKHLDFYDSFDHYNEYDFYHGFKVSEVERGGALYYEFANIEKDTLFYVNAEQTQGTLIQGDKEVTFEIKGVIGGTSAQGDIFLMDLTGDGKDEFVYYYTYGTGSWDTEVLVYDTETMVPYELQTDALDLANLVTMTPIEILDDSVRYEICMNEEVHTADIGMSADVLKDNTSLEKIAQNCAYDSQKVPMRIEVDYERGCLYMNCGLMPGSLTWYYIGELNADYIWDAESQSFVIDLDTAELVIY